jgi:hypothetical protein
MPRQEDQEFEASLSYVVGTCLKTTTKDPNGQRQFKNSMHNYATGLC